MQKFQNIQCMHNDRVSKYIYIWCSTRRLKYVTELAINGRNLAADPDFKTKQKFTEFSQLGANDSCGEAPAPLLPSPPSLGLRRRSHVKSEKGRRRVTCGFWLFDGLQVKATQLFSMFSALDGSGARRRRRQSRTAVMPNAFNKGI